MVWRYILFGLCRAPGPPDGPAFVCTLWHGHRGDHEAHGDESRLLARWPR